MNFDEELFEHEEIENDDNKSYNKPTLDTNNYNSDDFNTVKEPEYEKIYSDVPDEAKKTDLPDDKDDDEDLEPLDPDIDPLRDDLNDIFGNGTDGALQEKPKRISKHNIRFETFVCDEMVGEDTVHRDKIWEELFLRRIALFPTLAEAQELSKQKLESGDIGPVGTVPWFEGPRPYDLSMEAFHMDRLLLRMREWAQESTGLAVRFDAFAERLEIKSQKKENMHKFADHRIDMIKKIVDGNWVDESCNFIRERIEDEERKVQDRKDNELAARQEMLNSYAKINKNMTDDPSVNEPSTNRHDNVSDIASTIEERKRKLLEKKRNTNTDLDLRRQRLLEKKRNLANSDHTGTTTPSVVENFVNKAETPEVNTTDQPNKGSESDRLQETIVNRRKRLLDKKKLL